ncbi:MAG: cysteine hydrolase family protein [Nitrospinota bacterium]
MEQDAALAEWVDPSTSALIVVDVQNDFCHPEGIFGKRGVDMAPIEEMLPRLQRLMEEARGVGVRVVLLWVTHSPDCNWSAYHKLERLKFGSDYYGPDYSLLVEDGTWGAELCEGFEPKPGDILIKKNRYGGFTGTNLDLVLRSMGVKTLIMTGVATNVCVESTVREGFMLDYNVVLVDDACATTSREEHEGTLLNCRLYFGRVATVDEVAAAWAERGATAKR